MSWGPWITDEEPEVGAYIQAYCKHKDTGEPRVFEGRLVNKVGHLGYLDPHPGIDGRFWLCLRWREWVEKGPSAFELLKHIVEEPGVLEEEAV